MKVRVDVTAEDIANGCQHMASSCPVAKAISRALGTSVYVNTTGGKWGKNSELDLALGHPLPMVVVQAARKFDRSGEMRPFVFDIELPDSEQREHAAR